MDGARRSGYSAVVVVLAVVVIVGTRANPVWDTRCSVRVLGTMKLIPRGTSGEAIVKRRMYVTLAFPCDGYQYEAISDPAALPGTTALRDILPGQLLTETAFAPR